MNLSADRVADGGRDADERGRLSACPVDHGDSLLRLCHPGGWGRGVVGRDREYREYRGYREDRVSKVIRLRGNQAR